jgi:hypothetical protein
LKNEEGGGVDKMNEIGSTRYGNGGTIIPNMERKMAAENAIAAIKKSLSDTQLSYGIVRDILQIADEIAYYSPLQ